MPPTVHHSVACPACGLLCDDLEVTVEREAVRVSGRGCAKSERFFSAPSGTQAMVGGRAASWQEAVTEASRILRGARRPLFLSAGADVAAMRVLLKLAEDTGGVVDSAGDALFRNVPVLQDGGWVSTTLTEVRNRADLLVAAGTDIAGRFPRFFERCFAANQAMFHEGAREAWFIGRPPPDPLPDVRAQAIDVPLERLGEIFGALRAQAAGRSLAAESIAGVPRRRLEELLARMRAARYGVLAWAAAELDTPHADLAVQSMCELVKTLNAKGRFAVLPLAAAGDMTAMQVCTWQTGYPLRVSFARGAPSFDPVAFSGRRLLEEGSADAVLTVSAFEEQAPAAAGAPRIVLGRNETPNASVFIPVATPGIHHAGHLFRTDSVVAVPLRALVAGRVPAAAQALLAIAQGLGK